MIIDTHAHLTNEKFKKDLKTIVSQLQDNGISHVFTIGYDLKSSKKSLKLAKKYSNIYAVIGIHPSDISDLTQKAMKWLEKNSSHPKVLAIGEIGLDYHYANYDRQSQVFGFIAQMKLAHKAQLPIVIHTRDASEDLINVLKENKHLLTYGGIVHCFSDDYEFYKQVASLGLIVSVGGAITFKNAKNLQETVAKIPLKHIVLETDSPYLTPMPYRGRKMNEPKYTKFVAEKLAELHNTTYDQVASTTNQNVQQLFKKFMP